MPATMSPKPDCSWMADGVLNSGIFRRITNGFGPSLLTQNAQPPAERPSVGGRGIRVLVAGQYVPEKAKLVWFSVAMSTWLAPLTTAQ